MEIRKLCWNEIHLALALVWDVFLEYEAPDYAREIYGKLGFQAIAAEQVTNGFRYIPMVYVKKGLQKA